MTYFLSTQQNKESLLCWKYDGKNLNLLRQPNRLLTRGPFEISPEEPTLDNFRNRLRLDSPFYDVEFFNVTLNPGEHYPRMARPIDCNPDSLHVLPIAFPLDSDVFYPPLTPDTDILLAISRSQLVTLINKLENILQTVHPTDEKLDVYGHEIRNLLILACTEVEAQCKGVLMANGYSKSEYLNMEDYSKLNKAMRLNEYSIILAHYPWLDKRTPFKSWGIDENSLAWYQGYNAVKHDREKNFKKATLENVLNAVCACMILLVAQFGIKNVTKNSPELNYYFALSDKPKWTPEEAYIFPYDTDGKYTAKEYKFV